MAYPTPAQSVSELLRNLAGSAHVEDGRLVIDSEAQLRDSGIRAVVWSATFSPEPDVIDAARWIVWQAAHQLGAISWSIHDLYMARGRGEVGGFTVPAVNLRTQVFDMAAAMCRAADSIDAGALIFELARSEQEYTYQRPGEYITSVLAGCVSAGWRGPVFVQGDHYQFNAKKYADDPDGTTEAIRRLTRDAIGVGYGNIDIDSSTLVDLSLATVDEQQRVNYEQAARLAKFVRELQPEGIDVSLGGEIGEVGTENSTVEELHAYMQGFNRTMEEIAPGVAGLSKISVQSGTTHGGVVLADGTIADVQIDFSTLERLSTVARNEYGLSGAVQHGASTLPDSAFNNFPRTETAEIHLATNFQTMLYDRLPEALRGEIYEWLKENAKDERKPSDSDEQFFYKTRKKAIGPFKRQMWGVDSRVKAEIAAAYDDKFEFLFTQLGITGTASAVAQHVKPVVQHRPQPHEGMATVAAAPDDADLSD